MAPAARTVPGTRPSGSNEGHYGTGLAVRSSLKSPLIATSAIPLFPHLIFRTLFAATFFITLSSALVNTNVSAQASTGHKSSGSNIGVIVGVSVGAVTFLLACVSLVAFCLWQRRSGMNPPQLGHPYVVSSTEHDSMYLELMPVRFSYKHLSVATKGFSEEMKLGQGGFGSVYRGVLPPSGVAVAVKKINSDSKQGEKEFMAEIFIISQLRHRNLIQLQGWCKDAAKQQYLLVYELMPNGSLDKVLFQEPAVEYYDSSSSSACLSWEQRFKILSGTAAALDYLHQGWKRQVIHRDIKSSNIMLDHEWNAKLGDFGLARLVDHQISAAMTDVAGTRGYLAPEAVTTGRFTEKSDVFAFGAVVLEIACGQRAFSPADVPPHDDYFFLVDRVWNSFSKGTLLSTVDKLLRNDYDAYWMNVVLIVGLWCSNPNAEARPSMRRVVQVLAGDAPVPSIPASKPVFNPPPPKFSMDSSVRQNSMSWRKSGSISAVSIDSPSTIYESAPASLNSTPVQGTVLVSTQLVERDGVDAQTPLQVLPRFGQWDAAT